MDNTLKGLIAATCIVIIAGVGYFVWRDYSGRPSKTEVLLQQHKMTMKEFDQVFGTGD
ncbi:MAG: hypothetical protein ACTHNH_21090 [Mesorhizobium sp.]